MDAGLAWSSIGVWPSRCKHTVGTRIVFFEARFPARRCLCLRFTRHLAAPSARLEVKMVRYSFLVGLITPYCTPVYPGDCACLRARLRSSLESTTRFRDRERFWVLGMAKSRCPPKTVKHPWSGCLSVLGVPSRNHVVCFGGIKVGANGGLKLCKGCVDLWREVVSKPGSGGGYLAQSCQSIPEHGAHV